MSDIKYEIVKSVGVLSTSAKGKERYINGKYSSERTFTCPICGRLSNAIPILKLHAKEVHGKDIDIITFPMQDEEYPSL